MKNRKARNSVPILILGIIIFSCSGLNPLVADAQDGVLTVKIAGLTSDSGSVMFALFNSSESFMDLNKAFRRDAKSISNKACQWVVEDLPPGRYAISVYHDENGNSKLDTGLFGAPKEPYGFSNNARGKFGPPDWEDAVFEFKSPEQVMEIKVE